VFTQYPSSGEKQSLHKLTAAIMSYWDRKRKQPRDIVVSDSEPDEETVQDGIPRRANPPSQSTIPGRPTELRGYQKDAVNACIEALKEGLTRIAVSSPTASGKTVMFMALMPLVPAPRANPKANKILILTNNLVLFKQTKKMVQKEHGKRYAVGVYQAGNRPTEHEDV
jgi:superfamily II DNA or RNA helicase